MINRFTELAVATELVTDLHALNLIFEVLVLSSWLHDCGLDQIVGRCELGQEVDQLDIDNINRWQIEKDIDKLILIHTTIAKSKYYSHERFQSIHYTQLDQ